MTDKPYIEDSTGDIDLGYVKTETITGTQPIISVSAAGGESKDNIHATLMSGSRRISITAEKKFTNQADINTFFQRIDALKKGNLLDASKFYSSKITEPYSGQAYFNGFITNFEVQDVEGEESFLLTYSLEFEEGKGLND